MKRASTGSRDSAVRIVTTWDADGKCRDNETVERHLMRVKWKCAEATALERSQEMCGKGQRLEEFIRRE